MKTCLLALIVAFLMMTHAAATPQPPLAARGPHSVGVRTLELTDPARARTLTAEVWYPTSEADEAITYDAVFGRGPAELRGRAKRDAAPTTETFPLIVVSHGQPATRYQLTYLGEHLASRGFVVANLEHTSSTYRDMTDADYVTSLVYRPEDILFAIDAVPEQVSNADNSTVGLIGYSYGGYSVVRAAGVDVDPAALSDFCRRSNDANPCFAAEFLAGLADAAPTPDPRIKAVFVMAPYGQPWFGEASLATLTAPFFVAAGDADDVALYDRDARAYFRGAGSASKYLLTLTGAQHNPFAECPEALRGIDPCFDPVWSQPQAHALMKHVASAFFGRFLGGEARFGRYLTPELPGVARAGLPGVRLEVGD